MPVCMPVSPYVRTHVLIYICISLCTCVRPYVHMSVCMYACFFLGLNGDNRCTFYTGDGTGGSDEKVGNQKGSSCIDICLELRKTDKTINGVIVFADASKGGCWCKKQMTGTSSVTKYKSCFIGDKCTSHQVVFITNVLQQCGCSEEKGSNSMFNKCEKNAKKVFTPLKYCYYCPA